MITNWSMRINLTDNNIGQVKAGTFLRKDVSALFPIADKTIWKGDNIETVVIDTLNKKFLYCYCFI